MKNDGLTDHGQEIGLKMCYFVIQAVLERE